MSRLFCFLFLLTSATALAQAVIPGVDFQVAPDSANASNIEIAAGADGTYLVAHDSTVHFYDSEMSALGVVTTTKGHIRYPFIINASDFAFLGSSGEPCSGPYGFYGTSQYYAVQNHTQSEFTGAIYDWRYCQGINGEFDVISAYAGGSAVAGDFMIFCVNLYSVSDYFLDVRNSAKVCAINRYTGETGTILQASQTETVGLPGPGMPPPKQLLFLARGANGEFGVYTDHRDSTSFQVFDAIADRVGDDMVIESNITNPEYRFKIPLLTNDRILLLHRYHYSDSLRADIYDRNGSPIVKGLSLGISTDTTDSHRKTDASPYFIADVTDNNSVVVLWEGRESNGDINLYVRLFSENGVPLSITKRVNSDTAGIQKAPRIETRGDTVYVGWVSRYPGFKYKVFTKVFTTNDITPVAPLPIISECAITGIYPQPAQGRITLQHTVPAISRGSELRIYNILGRELSRRTVSGEQTTIDLHMLPPGMYRAVIRDGQHYAQRLFIVTR